MFIYIYIKAIVSLLSSGKPLWNFNRFTISNSFNSLTYWGMHHAISWAKQNRLNIYPYFGGKNGFDVTNWLEYSFPSFYLYRYTNVLSVPLCIYLPLLIPSAYIFVSEPNAITAIYLVALTCSPRLLSLAFIESNYNAYGFFLFSLFIFAVSKTFSFALPLLAVAVCLFSLTWAFILGLFCVLLFFFPSTLLISPICLILSLLANILILLFRFLRSYEHNNFFTLLKSLPLSFCTRFNFLIGSVTYFRPFSTDKSSFHSHGRHHQGCRTYLRKRTFKSVVVEVIASLFRLASILVPYFYIFCSDTTSSTNDLHLIFLLCLLQLVAESLQLTLRLFDPPTLHLLSLLALDSAAHFVSPSAVVLLTAFFYMVPLGRVYSFLLATRAYSLSEFLSLSPICIQTSIDKLGLYLSSCLSATPLHVDPHWNYNRLFNGFRIEAELLAFSCQLNNVIIFPEFWSIFNINSGLLPGDIHWQPEKNFNPNKLTVLMTINNLSSPKHKSPSTCIVELPTGSCLEFVY